MGRRPTEKNFGRVRRTYIETLRDKALPLAFQRRMRSDLPCSTTLTMDTGHSPFFSAPEKLVEHLVSVPTKMAA